MTAPAFYDGLNPVQEKSGSTVTANLLTGLGIDEFLTRTDGVGSRALLTDALGSTVALGDNTGTLQTQYTYEPFGYTTQSGQASTNSYKYTGREEDGTGLLYYRARYYHPRLQRFISEDPIGFRGGDFNLYAYVADSPVNRNDPYGNWAGFDDLAFAGAGALVGLAGQGLGDLLSGRSSEWQDYVGSAIGGAVGGEVLLYGGPITAGAAGGAATNVVKQALKSATGVQCDMDYYGFLWDTTIGAFTGILPGSAIPGISAGINSYNAIFRQMITKIQNGTISNVSALTAAKMAIGRNVDTGAIPGIGASGVASGIFSLLPDRCTCATK